MNYKEFAANVKAKYPEYKDIDDLDLTTKMQEKFPGSYDDIEVPVRQVEKPKPPVFSPQGAVQGVPRAFEQTVGPTTQGFSEMFGLARQGKWPQATLHGLGTTAGSVGRSLASPVTLGLNVLAGSLPRSTATIGKAVSELPVGGGRAGMYPMATPTPETAMGPQQTVADIGQSAEEFKKKHPELSMALGDVVNIASLAPTAKLMEPILSSITRGAPAALGKGLERASVGQAATKIAKKEALMGAKPEYFAKYNIMGPAKEQLPRWSQGIQQRAKELKQVLAKAEDPSNKVDMANILARAEENVLKSTSYDRPTIRNLMTSEKNKNSIWNNWFDKYGNKLDKLDLAEAQQLKRETGLKGDWMESPYGGKSQVNSDIKSKIYNEVYDQLKKELETRGGPSVKKLNTEMSEMIPMERAMAKAYLNEQKANKIPFDTYIGLVAAAATGNVGPLAVAGGQYALKNPVFSKYLYKAGKSLQPKAPMTNEQVEHFFGTYPAAAMRSSGLQMSENAMKEFNAFSPEFRKFLRSRLRGLPPEKNIGYRLGQIGKGVTGQSLANLGSLGYKKEQK